ncbi:D-alanine transferase DltD domain protein [[Clostridium] sordellii ATCC 9714]|nr:D-alanine transferase DltD domain protein [[Clostridium] sordellii ATCC 9714] [Paeniclostridium sordellii ATCC 9714]
MGKRKEKAIEDAKKRVGKNDLSIDKIYYKKNFGHNLDRVRGKYKNVDLLNLRSFMIINLH